MNIPIATSNCISAASGSLGRFFNIDPALAKNPVSMVVGNIYTIDAARAVALLMRNSGNAAATVVIHGGERLDGRALTDIELEIPNDGGAGAHAAMIDPAFGFLIGQRHGKVKCHVKTGQCIGILVDFDCGFAI